jgi:hypothetical protein
MSLNGVAPQPTAQTARAGWQVWDYGTLPAGTPFDVWISWQTNPTNVGRHAQTVALYDGSRVLMTARRTVIVFP